MSNINRNVSIDKQQFIEIDKLAKQKFQGNFSEALRFTLAKSVQQATSLEDLTVGRR